MPDRTVDHVIAGVVLTFNDVTRITAAEARISELTRALNIRVHTLEALIDIVPVGILITEDARASAIRINRYGTQLLGEGGKAAPPRPLAADFQIIHKDRALARDDFPLQHAVRSGQPVAEYEAVLVRPDGTRIDVLMSATPLFDDEGKVGGGIAVILDISERKRGEAQQQVLLHELQHRVKNIITTVGALATRMLKGAASLEDFAASFTGRVSAMAKTHELLSASHWQGAALRPLIDATVRSYASGDGRNISVAGPEVVLAPTAASTLGLVLYELATNAVKYGALRERNGRVDISWRLTKRDGGEDVILDWAESDGPPIDGVAADGFGTGFIRRSVAYELGGKADLELQPTGMRCRIAFPGERNLLAGPTALGGQSHVPSSD
jgi:two-component system CheB/CheR fusion protein